jgi:hypothetical protein
MAAHIDTIIKHIAQQICNVEVPHFKAVISDVIAYPTKLIGMPSLVTVFSSSYKGAINFNDLQKETGIEFKNLRECIQTKHHTVKEFLYEIENNNQDFNNLRKIIKIGTNDGTAPFYLNKKQFNSIKKFNTDTTRKDQDDSATCNAEILKFKTVISDVVEDPMKLNAAQALASLMHRSQFDLDDLQLNNINFNELKSHYGDLQRQLDSAFECPIIHRTPEQFFYEVLKDNKDAEDFMKILNVATNDGVGDSAITFNIDADKLNTINNILGRSYDEDFE